MQIVGSSFHEARTGFRYRMVDADEREGKSFSLEYSLPPGAGPAVDPHFHQHWQEEFEVLEGSARYSVAGEEGGLAVGERVTLPPGRVHVHPWNGGDAPLRIRQTTTLLRPDPEAVRDTFRATSMLIWLSNQGRVDRQGKPPLLQGALIFRTLQRHGLFLAGAPVPVQRAVVGGLARIAEWRGLSAFDPRCLDG